MPASKFPKPAGGLPARGDASAFLSRDFAPPLPGLLEQPAPPAEPPPAPVRRGPARARLRELKVPITYKHRESNFRILKKISQRLDIPIGDLLDEALEARFPEWKARIAVLPPEDF